MVAFWDAPVVVELGLPPWELLATLAPSWRHDLGELVAAVQAVLPGGAALVADLAPFVDWKSLELLCSCVGIVRARLRELARELEGVELQCEAQAASLRAWKDRRQRCQDELNEARRVKGAIEDLRHGAPEAARGLFADLKPEFR